MPQPIRPQVRILSALAVLLAAGCQKPTGFTVFVASSAQPAISSFFEFLPQANGQVVASSDPAGDVKAGRGTGVRVALLTDLTCDECYQLTGSNYAYQVHAGSLLGMQYGLAELLEAFNFRFFHPWSSKVPASLTSPDKSSAIGPTFTPQMTLRGLHLHTIHPIEAYHAFWEPSAAHLEDARRISDWTVKNRGNYIEWCALNDIVTPGQAQTEWQAHTKAIIDDAHQRGLKIGIAVELFGTANLQLAYDLFDSETEITPDVVDARLHIILDGLPFDTVDLSFGEFSGSSPTVFLDAVNLTYQELQKIAPGAELSATVHLDNSPGLQVTYMGETLPYYFLVQFANPNIVPWIHTVMYYDFYQDTSGAYLYNNFDEHLAYLQNQEKAGKPVGYYPESAYWVAFDDSVPTYLPVYMRSRWLDMNNLRAASTAGGYAQLTQHVEFSSGFEWDYWQNDYATLRMNFGLPAQWGDMVQDMFSPWGSQGQQLATQITALGELQSAMLIDQHLGPYLAGRDAVIDAGAAEGVVSQPPRPQFTDIMAMSTTDRATFTSTVLTPLTSLLTSTQQIQASVAALGLDATDPWLSEVSDGLAVDEARTRFITALYQAVVAFAAQGTDAGWLAKADAALADGQTVVARRDAHLHYPEPDLLVERITNSTLYQYGYLYEADTLCYWERERIQARAIIVKDPTPVPACIF